MILHTKNTKIRKTPRIPREIRLLHQKMSARAFAPARPNREHHAPQQLAPTQRTAGQNIRLQSSFFPDRQTFLHSRVQKAGAKISGSFARFQAPTAGS
jgi:hypothetical protein